MIEVAGDVIALIPAYNEVAHVALVVGKVLQFVPAVVIDDGSVDGSGAAAASAGATVITHQHNRGKGAALNTGFEYAIQHDAAAAITLDADGQHDPEEIPRFLAAYHAGLGNLIIGRRTFSQMPTIRRLANRASNWILRFAMGRPVLDNQSGYRLLDRAVLRQARPTSTGFEAEVEILQRTQLAGLRIGWVPIRTIYADEVSHYRPARDAPIFFKMVWRIWMARRRGRFE